MDHVSSNMACVLPRSENIQVQKPEVVLTELKNFYNIPNVDIIDILKKFKGKQRVIDYPPVLHSPLSLATECNP